jgi:hypothetical protein
MYDYTATGPEATTRYPLVESLIVCLIGLMVLVGL